MKEVNISNVLRKHVAKKYKTMKAAAAAWDVSTGLVSMILSGDRNPTEAMLNEIGYERLPCSPRYAKVKNDRGNPSQHFQVP